MCFKSLEKLKIVTYLSTKNIFSCEVLNYEGFRERQNLIEFDH